METKSVQHKIKINATAEDVWDALWDNEKYMQWAHEFLPGSRYKGKIEEGEEVQFLDGAQNGMQSRVLKVERDREVIFNHLFEIKSGTRGDSLNNMEERYFLDETEGVTTLSMNSETPSANYSEMNEAGQRALQRIKEIAEGQEFKI